MKREELESSENWKLVAEFMTHMNSYWLKMFEHQHIKKYVITQTDRDGNHEQLSTSFTSYTQAHKKCNELIQENLF